MKKFYLIANPLKKGTKETAQEITEYLQQKGAQCEGISPDNQYSDVVPKDVDCVITLGGDGTLIRAAKNLYTHKVPILGINMGNMGYLTQISREEDVTSTLDALLEDNYRLEHRMMLEGEIVEDGNVCRKTGISLNEVVISRDGGMQPIHFELFVNGIFLNEYTADGLIVATPTGSTAYNLSAGGPIVTPVAELMVVTPICSHALNSSSIVLNADDEIEIHVKNQMGQRQVVVFDGDHTITLNENRRLIIRRSQFVTTLVRVKDISFLDNLRNKMTRI